MRESERKCGEKWRKGVCVCVFGVRERERGSEVLRERSEERGLFALEGDRETAKKLDFDGAKLWLHNSFYHLLSCFNLVFFAIQ